MKLNDIFPHIAHNTKDDVYKNFLYNILRDILKNRRYIGIENECYELQRRFNDILIFLNNQYPNPDYELKDALNELIDYSMNVENNVESFNSSCEGNDTSYTHDKPFIIINKQSSCLDKLFTVFNLIVSCSLVYGSLVYVAYNVQN